MCFLRLFSRRTFGRSARRRRERCSERVQSSGAARSRCAFVIYVPFRSGPTGLADGLALEDALHGSRSATRPRAARLPPKWFPRSGRLGKRPDSALDLPSDAAAPGRGDSATGTLANAGRRRRRPTRAALADCAPVGAVLAVLREHVREHPEAEPVEQEAEERRHPVRPRCCPLTRRRGRRTGRAAGRSRPRRPRGRRRSRARAGPPPRARAPPAADRRCRQLARQRVLLVLRAAAHLVGREEREAEQHERGADNADQTDDRAHRGYYRPPPAEPDHLHTHLHTWLKARASA